jgi:hypothetical protein
LSQNDSSLWSVGIGLAKLQGDQQQILQRFVSAFNSLQNYKSNIWSKLLAAEIIAATNADFTSLSDELSDLDNQLRTQAHVPEEQSVGIAATLLYGSASDTMTTFSRFVDFSKITESQEAAAILSITTTAVQDLTDKFHSYKDLFNDWGYSTSDDTDLAASYLAISPLVANDVKDRMNTIVDAIRNDLAYPLVAAAILTSMSSLAPAEVIDLMEKGVAILQSYIPNLGRSELVSLSVRMVHGVNNELARQLDPNAKLTNTPVQFTQNPQSVYGQFYGGFYPGLWWFYPLIISHFAYHNTYIIGGGTHEAHSHGVGGFS